MLLTIPTAHIRQSWIRCLLAALLLAAVVSLASLPSAASAKSPAQYWSFSISGTHGYRIVVSANRKQVNVFVDGRAAFVEYAAPARTDDGVVEADIGGLGSLAMRFIPRGVPKRSDEPNGCHGPRPTYQKGHVEGTFRFRGERDFTSAYGRHASAVAERGFAGLCRGAGGQPEIPNLVAQEKSGRRTMTVSTYFREYEVATRAEVAEQVEGLNILRAVSLAAPLSAGSVEPDGSASISPPSPFSGTAHYAPSSPGPSWTGDLGANFPGIGTLRLAGPRFQVLERSPLPLPAA